MLCEKTRSAGGRCGHGRRPGLAGECSRRSGRAARAGVRAGQVAAGGVRLHRCAACGAGERRACWQLAEAAGHATPRRMQALLAGHIGGTGGRRCGQSNGGCHTPGWRYPAKPGDPHPDWSRPVTGRRTQVARPSRLIGRQPRRPASPGVPHRTRGSVPTAAGGTGVAYRAPQRESSPGGAYGIPLSGHGFLPAMFP
jgi:hypothetical protein